MPQLMPLNWMFSSVVLLLVIISASIIFSEKMMKIELNKLSSNNMKINYWCW